MASVKNLRRTAAQMGYSHRGLNRWMLKIRIFLYLGGFSIDAEGLRSYTEYNENFNEQKAVRRKIKGDVSGTAAGDG